MWYKKKTAPAGKVPERLRTAEAVLVQLKESLVEVDMGSDAAFATALEIGTSLSGKFPAFDELQPGYVSPAVSLCSNLER